MTQLFRFGGCYVRVSTDRSRAACVRVSSGATMTADEARQLAAGITAAADEIDPPTPGGIPQADALVAVALASIAIHAEELLGPGGHQLDGQAITGLLAQPGVRDYLDELAALALLPVKR